MMKAGSKTSGRPSAESRCFFVFSLVVLILASSCDLLRDSPFDVEAWTPGEGYHSDPVRIRVSILLSHDCDRVKTEEAFSLTEDRRALKGVFSWEASTLVFTPASPLEADRDYILTLGTGAQDSNGLSLEKKFEASFTTRRPGGKAGIIRTEPVYEGYISGERGEFRLFFSDPVILGSCMDFISFAPSAPGSWQLEDGNRTACFTPKDPWQTGVLYRVNVESGFAGASGAIIGTEYTTIFTAGADREKPVLLSAFAVFPGEAFGGETKREGIPFTRVTPGKTAPYPVTEYNGWENSTRLELKFSKPVDPGVVSNLLAGEPAVPLFLESGPAISDRVIFSFTEYPEWGSSFLFRLSGGVKDRAGNESAEEYLFRIAYTGPLSRPPSLAGIRFPMAPGHDPDITGASQNHEPLCYTAGDLFADLPVKFGEYPFSVRTPTWIELYFETAYGTEIDLFSVMDLFRVEATNQALGFSPVSVTGRDFAWLDPEGKWKDLMRLEIRGFLTNSINSGVVTFHIPPGLKDKRGNRSPVDFRISLLK